MTELDAGGGETGAELLGVVYGGGAVDFSDSVDLTGEETAGELAPPPLPLPEHLPPEDKVTSTQFFWPSTGLE